MQQHLDLQLQRYQLKGMYITNPVNIRYLTGFSGSYGVLLLIPGKKILMTDERYLEEAKKSCKETHVVNVISKEWQEILKNMPSIAYNASHMTVDRLKKLKEKFSLPRWIATPPIVENMRREKNSLELTCIKHAARIGCESVNFIYSELKEGKTEKEIAWLLERFARENGADSLSFPPIVAFGENSAIPHHESGDRALKVGDAILIDFGVYYHGYSSDMTRTCFFKSITPRQEEIYNIVLEAQKIGIQKMKIGNTCFSAYEAVTAFFIHKKLQKYFTHALGHGVGLDIHEAPTISKRSQEHFMEWQVVTCEPGLYLPGEFGVRIEDLGVIHKDGFQIYSGDCSKYLKVIQ
jgi:Xaa-Pro aminopeptidase